MNRGVEMAVDPAELPGSTILHQVTNGVAVRMAVLFELLGSGADIAPGRDLPTETGVRS
jgi:aspartate carbamoyltransferase catalytic subunit